jgi:hypothetical protein
VRVESGRHTSRRGCKPPMVRSFRRTLWGGCDGGEGKLHLEERMYASRGYYGGEGGGRRGCEDGEGKVHLEERIYASHCSFER